MLVILGSTLPFSIQTSGFMRLRLSLLLVLVLALRSLLPAGYMPVKTSNGISIVICTSKGSKAVLVDANGDLIDDHGTGQAGEPCAFAGIASLALPPVEASAEPLAEEAANGRIELSFGLPPIRAGPTLGSRAPPNHS